MAKIPIPINVNSIISNNKRAYLSHFLENFRPDILLVTETKLNTIHKLGFKDYNMIRNDRQTEKDRFKCLEMSIIEFKLRQGQKLRIASVYADHKHADQFEDELNKTFELLEMDKIENYFIIAGDYNAKHRDWSNGITKLYGTQEPTYPRTNSFLDIGIIDTRLKLETNYNNKLKTLPYGSDHSACLIDLKEAFNTVWNDGLIYKLIEYNIPNNMIKMIKDMIEERKFVVRNGKNCTNKIIKNKNGLQQDTLQEDFNEVQDYVGSWKLRINYSKYEVILFRNSLDKCNRDANISQTEYETKYTKYLTKLRERKKLELLEDNEFISLREYRFPKLFHSIRSNITQNTKCKVDRKKRSLNTEILNLNTVFVRFSIKDDDYESSDDIEEANLRLMIITNSKFVTVRKLLKNDANSHLRWLHHAQHQHKLSNNQSKHLLNIKIYQLIEPHGKIWLDSKKIEIDTRGQTRRWLEFDVTKAVETWVNGEQENLGLEIQCDKCHLYGAKIIDDSYAMINNKNEENKFSEKLDTDFNPILNIIGQVGGIKREKRSHQYHHNTNSGTSSTPNNVDRRKRKTECYEGNTRCCRHSMEVVFKEIKDFSFIIQPKIFDAGYCRGRCPPRYNPAHHHAVLQSLIWKKDRSKAPRPCCAPSKLVELEVLHIDENDSTKLKVSRWNDMKVIECACS
ncbi:uncharacterized protein LOC129616535 [Condylostylus longicornis]|uniref:uncharacterized protein LOC129616535 n=1 Tax=Condylostylus longicornis TaxID=2530218 RepID=UPI00244E3406|nr:uncharacterized protein LOC129616535 [Condylostylus longicornis]